jgi:flagellar biosynthesis protein
MPDAPLRKAVAMRYRDGEDAAPRVVAKGRGLLADEIVEIARREGVAVKQDGSLVEVLSALEVDALIPAELYEALAHLLSWVYQTDKRYAARRRASQRPSY